MTEGKGTLPTVPLDAINGPAGSGCEAFSGSSFPDAAGSDEDLLPPFERPPDQTAATLPLRMIALATGAGTLAVTAGILLSPVPLVAILGALVAMPFLAMAVLRLAALWTLLSANHPTLSAIELHEADLTGSGGSLPRYTVLVPLYDEADVIRQLISALESLEYPVERLEILLIVEADDPTTRRALAAVNLPGHFRIVDVPPGEPRTKPRALNHAMRSANGEYVTVFDAEDIPEPKQLLKALAVLQKGQGRIGCVQARLEIYNPHSAWLSRQFTIEYASLFGALLPALERYHLPIPLGGTSNHFPGILAQTHQMNLS